MQCYCCANTTTIIIMIEGRSSDPGARKRLLGAKRSSDPCALAKKTAANTPTQCLRHSALPTTTLPTKRLLGARRSSDPCALAKKTAATTPTPCASHPRASHHDAFHHH